MVGKVNMKRIIAFVILIMALVGLPACTITEPLPESVFTKDIYPSANNTYDLGSSALMWRKGYIGVLTVTDNTSIHTLDGSTWGGGGGGGGSGTVTSLSAGAGITLVPDPIINIGTVAIDNTVVTLTGAQVLTNKTLTAPVINGIVTTTGLTLPAFTAGGDITTDRWLSTNGNTVLGVDVVGNDSLAHTAGSEGYYNTAIGYRALFNITTSYFNTAIGAYALSDVTTGTYNTAVGQLALGDVSTGNFNTAVGMQALAVNTGSYNTAIGLFAGTSNVVGDSNIFIGASAGKSELGSNKLYIDVEDTATPLIYGDFSTNNVTINGDFHVANDLIDMSQIAVEPSSTADRAGIYAWDLAADNCTIGFNTEAIVQTALGVASQNRIPVRWNGVTYYLLAEITSFRTPIVNTIEPTIEQGAVVDMVFFNTTTDTWKKCTSLSPLTWTTLSSGGATAWGSITGNITTQTDLNGILNSKLSAITGTELDNIFSSNGLLKRTGIGTYVIDESAYLTSFTELDPAVKALTGIIVSNGSTISAITDNHSNWDAAFGWGNHASAGYLTAITGAGLDNVFSSSGLLKRTGVATYTVDSSTYLTSNQNITLSSDASGSGTTSIAVTNTGLKGVALPTLATGYLYYNGSAWAFQTPSGGSVATDVIWDTKGDLAVGTGADAAIKLASSGVNNNVLTVDTTTATGLKWAAPAGGNDPRIFTHAVAAGEQHDVTASTALTNVSVIDIPLTVGTYTFQYYVIYRSNQLTNGIRLAVNYTGTNGAFVWWWRWADVLATASSSAPDQDQIIAAGAVQGSFASRVKSTTTRGTTLSVDTINDAMLIIIEGVFIATGAGDLELWHGSELATAAYTTSVMPGTSVIVTKTE